jgi:hypothetical protein
VHRFSVLLLTAAMAVVPQWALAADNFSITVSSTNITGSCDDSVYKIEFSWLSTFDDGDGYDLVTMIATDEDDRASASDWTGIDPGEVGDSGTTLGNGQWINSIVPGKDITVEVFDSLFPHPPFGSNYQSQYDDIAARPEPVALSLTFNPGNCDTELLVTATQSEEYVPVPVLTPIGLAGLFVVLLLAGGLSIQRRLS